MTPTNRGEAEEEKPAKDTEKESVWWDESERVLRHVKAVTCPWVSHTCEPVCQVHYFTIPPSSENSKRTFSYVAINERERELYKLFFKSSKISHTNHGLNFSIRTTCRLLPDRFSERQPLTS